MNCTYSQQSNTPMSWHRSYNDSFISVGNTRWYHLGFFLMDYRCSLPRDWRSSAHPISVNCRNIHGCGGATDLTLETVTSTNFQRYHSICCIFERCVEFCLRFEYPDSNVSNLSYTALTWNHSLITL
jgi:hypothetical protein